MTTDRDKLQKLFQAALNDSSWDKPQLTRAFPTSPPPEQAAAQPVVQVVPEPTPVVEAADFVQPLANAGLDEAAAAKLKII